MTHSVLPVEDITKLFIDKLGKPQHNDEGV